MLPMLAAFAHPAPLPPSLDSWLPLVQSIYCHVPAVIHRGDVQALRRRRLCGCRPGWRFSPLGWQSWPARWARPCAVLKAEPLVPGGQGTPMALDYTLRQILRIVWDFPVLLPKIAYCCTQRREIPDEGARRRTSLTASGLLFRDDGGKGN